MLLSTVKDEFVFHCQSRNLSPKTTKNYRKQIEYLLNYLAAEYQVTHIEDVKPEHIKTFLVKMKVSHKVNYINDLLKAFKVFFKYAHAEGYTDTLVTEKISNMKKPKVLIRTFSEAELKRLSNYYQGYTYQRVQSTVSEHDGFAIVVADDLNDKTKVLKEAIYDMTLAGDYVQYTNIKKGMYIDFSNQCPGLQIADICAGIFTASAKYERASEKEKHKYECGHELFFDYAYKKTRCCFYNADYDIYKFGVKEVPNGAGTAIAKTLAADIANKLSSDLWVEIHKADVE